MTEQIKPLLVIYGNCQAGALAYIFGADPVLSATYTMRYVPSFDDGTPGARVLAPEETARTAIVFEQVDPIVFPYRTAVPAGCPIVSFPSMDLTLLWPLITTAGYDEAPTPERPWGRFPQGDRVVVDCVDRELSVAEAMTFYEQHSAEYIGNLERRTALERGRLRAREAKADIKISDYLFDQIAKQNIFWSVNHPTMAPLAELARRLLAAALPAVPALRKVAIDATIATLPPDGPLAFFRVPIHPVVVDYFDMEWYRREDGPNYGLRYEARLTYEGYLRGMIEVSTRARRLQRASSEK